MFQTSKIRFIWHSFVKSLRTDKNNNSCHFWTKENLEVLSHEKWDDLLKFGILQTRYIMFFQHKIIKSLSIALQNQAPSQNHDILSVRNAFFDTNRSVEQKFYTVAIFLYLVQRKDKIRSVLIKKMAIRWFFNDMQWTLTALRTDTEQIWCKPPRRL